MIIKNITSVDQLKELTQNGFTVFDTEGDRSNKLPYWIYGVTFDKTFNKLAELHVGRISHTKEKRKLFMLEKMDMPYSSLDMTLMRAKNKTKKFFNKTDLPVIIYGSGVDNVMVNNLTNNEVDVVAYDIQYLFSHVVDHSNKRTPLLRAAQLVGIEMNRSKYLHNPIQDTNVTKVLVNHLIRNF